MTLELNPAENDQNQLRHVVRKTCSENNRFTWTGNRRDEMSLREAIKRRVSTRMRPTGKNFSIFEETLFVGC
jgi:hypothetical protein